MFQAGPFTMSNPKPADTCNPLNIRSRAVAL